MVSNVDKWIRIFDITDISKHRKGFTIYKVISLLYPESCPDAITKLTVWKRFNDFKKLHREIKVLHRKLDIKDKYPSLVNATFFKRFDEETLQVRQQSILNFLEFIGSHTQLFTSNECVKFFESSHTPADQLSNISSIRADLNLPEETEFLVNSDDDKTVSDSDSITTINSLQTSQNSIYIPSNMDSITILDGQIYPTPPHTPGSIIGDYEQYIIDASIHIDMATELENEKKYEEAFTAYKTAIEILLKNGKEEKMYEKKQTIRYKTEKYLIRAEKIYNMYLSPEVKNLKQITETPEYLIKQPLSDLYKYKVVEIIGTGMLVRYSDTQQLFYVKVIHKTMKFLDENLILPENVPFMVKLHNYYNCENALFLILEYCRGVKLRDYLKHHSEDSVFEKSTDEILKYVQETEVSATEDSSYSDLINEYKSSKGESSDGSFEKINKEDVEQPVKCRKMSEMSFSDETFVSNFTMPLKVVVKWTAQLLLTLEKLHVLGVVCGDFQSRNLLINNNGDLILTYMCNVNDFYDIFTNRKLCELAPEFYSFHKITAATDWWCFGTVLYELLVGMPFSDMHPNGLNRYLKIPKYVNAEGRSLLRQLLSAEPEYRLGFGMNGTENLKSHPFFSSVSWDQLIAKCNS